jgi:hypothetical protein
VLLQFLTVLVLPVSVKQSLTERSIAWVRAVSCHVERCLVCFNRYVIVLTWHIRLFQAAVRIMCTFGQPRDLGAACCWFKGLRGDA